MTEREQIEADLRKPCMCGDCDSLGCVDTCIPCVTILRHPEAFFAARDMQQDSQEDKD